MRLISSAREDLVVNFPRSRELSILATRNVNWDPGLGKLRPERCTTAVNTKRW